MKRLHVHLSVDNLDGFVRFSSPLCAAEPTIREPDYALDNPRMNFAILRDRGVTGIHHFGIRIEDPGELLEANARLEAADPPLLEESCTIGCYAQSEKSWISAPPCLAWETFPMSGESVIYGGNAPAIGSNPGLGGTSCCKPALAAESKAAANAACGCSPAAASE